MARDIGEQSGWHLIFDVGLDPLFFLAYGRSFFRS